MTSPLSRLIAQAIIDARVSVCTHVPGYGGTETFRDYQDLLGRTVPYSFHEEPAYTIAHGAGLVGTRSACLIKTHGFAKAANSILSSLSAGVRGGTVIFAFDDEEGSHSDNIFSAPEFIRSSEVPTENLDEKNPYEHVLKTFERSEELGLPVSLLVKTAMIGREFEYCRNEIRWEPKSFQSDPDANLVCPPRAKYQRAILEAKISRHGSLDGIPRPAPLNIPSALPSPLREAATEYVPVFEAFRSVVRGRQESSRRVVCGDAGTSSLFAFDPYRCIDFGTYMGGSSSLAVGAALAGWRNSWAVTGDFSFISAGHLGLIEACHRGVALKVLVFNNQKASATGNQIIENGMLDLVLQPYSKFVRHVRMNDSIERIRQVIEEADRSEAMAIVVVS